MSNKVMIFPTDTVYGIGCSVFDKDAQKRIYEIKNRPTNKRLSVLCKDLAQIKEIAVVTIDAERLIKKFMPGGLTLILESKKELIGEGIFETVGVRIPNHPIALKLLEDFGPMATTSVNLSGENPLNDYEEIVLKFSDKVDKIYSNDLTSSKISSTVINMITKPYELIREGEISFEDILSFLNK